MRTLLLFIAGLLACTVPGFAAATDTTVTFPVGEWIATLSSLAASIAYPLAAIVVAWAGRVLPSALTGYLGMIRVDQLLERAIGYGLTAVKGAAAGQTLTVDVGNQVLAAALRYAIDHAPHLVQWAGGEAAIKAKILSRLIVVPEASVVTTLAGDPVLS